ncbi:hypothetical protein EBQ81_06490, partial [bacterium]|nr:hypothetical protein [bacterium]
MSNIPSEAKFIKPVNFNGVVKERRTTRISPLNGSVFGTNQIDRINFAIPSQSNYAIDMNTFHLHFKAEVFAATGTDPATYVVYFNNSIESIIDELIIKKGSSGQYLEDIKQYNYLDSIFMNFANSDYNRCAGKALLGIGAPQDRARYQNNMSVSGDLSAIATATSRKARRYTVPFRLSG